jgi:hypothetical protein
MTGLHKKEKGKDSIILLILSENYLERETGLEPATITLAT